jgi:dTMP kinase
MPARSYELLEQDERSHIVARSGCEIWTREWRNAVDCRGAPAVAEMADVTLDVRLHFCRLLSECALVAAILLLSSHGAGCSSYFEGIDGSGKTTQAHRLRLLLEQNGVPVLATREPTDGPWGTKIRRSAREGRLSPEAELEAFLEDRREHVQREVAPALASGRVVIMDRYYLSSVAYQGARGVDPAHLIRLNAFAPAPDLCFVFDVDPALGLSRISKRGAGADLFEQEQTLAAARRIFTDPLLFRATIPNLYVLDAMADAAALEARIAKLVFASLGCTLPPLSRDDIWCAS